MITKWEGKSKLKKNTGDSSQETGDGGQRSKDRGQRSEIRTSEPRRSEGRGQRSAISLAASVCCCLSSLVRFIRFHRHPNQPAGSGPRPSTGISEVGYWAFPGWSKWRKKEFRRQNGRRIMDHGYWKSLKANRENTKGRNHEKPKCLK